MAAGGGGKAILRNSARLIFKFQNSGTKVPSNVLAACRRADAYQATDADKKLIIGYIGGRKTGAGAIRAGVKGFKGPLDQLSKYAVLAGTAAQGGLGGALATGQLGNLGMQDLNAFVRANKPAFEAAAEAAGLQGIVGRRVANGLSAALRFGGAAVQAITAAAIASKIGMELGTAYSGRGNDDARRDSRFALDEVLDNPHLSALETKLAGKRWTASNQRQQGWGRLSEYAAERGAAALDSSAGEIGALDTRLALHRSGLTGAYSIAEVRAEGRKRHFRQLYGTTKLGELADWADRTLRRGNTSEAGVESGIDSESNKMISQADALRQAGFRFTAEGDFATATKKFQKAIEVMGGEKGAVVNMVVEDPAKLLPGIIAANDARAAWPLQNMKKNFRTWE